MDGQIGLPAAQSKALCVLMIAALGDPDVAGFSGGDLVLTAQPAGGLYVAFEGDSYLIAADGTTTEETD